MSRPRFLPVALALCLLALALAAHAEPAVFETELIAAERGDACTMADCWEGWHACTSDIVTADWERCSAVMEACKVRCSSGGRKGRTMEAAESPPCFVPIPVPRAREGVTWINPDHVSEYREDGATSVRVWVGSSRSRRLPISADRFEEILAEGCATETDTSETDAALRVLDLVTTLDANPAEDGFSLDWLTSYLWRLAIRAALDEERVAGWVHGLLTEANTANDLDLTADQVDQLSDWLARGIAMAAARHGDGSNANGGAPAAMKPERIQ